MTDITPDREKFRRGFPDSVKLLELEDEGMEFMDGICKTRECAWDVLLSESMKDQETTVGRCNTQHP